MGRTQNAHEFAALARANGLPLSREFFIFVHDELIGYGEYTSEDAHDRAFSDCTVREAEWELRGQNDALPTMAVNLDGVPEDQLDEMAHRTGSRRWAAMEEEKVDERSER